MGEKVGCFSKEMKNFAHHKQKIDEYYMIELVEGPVWKDECDHGAETYVCSWKSETVHGGKIYTSTYDLYVFNQPFYGQELCLRTGNEPGNYISPGGLTDFLARADQSRGYSSDAAKLLKYFGRLHWERRKEEDH